MNATRRKEIARIREQLETLEYKLNNILCEEEEDAFDESRNTISSLESAKNTLNNCIRELEAIE